MTRATTLALAVALALTGAACDRTRDDTPPTGTSPATTPVTGNPGTPNPTGGYTTGPTTVAREVPVPPVPVVTAVRAATHSDEGFDRITFDITGPAPGYDIRYVDKVLADPSDQPVQLAGRHFLLITIRPADAHSSAGAATIPSGQTLNFPMLKAWALAGDFEAVVTIALGVDDVAGYRVGELPGRIYVDVAT